MTNIDLKDEPLPDYETQYGQTVRLECLKLALAPNFVPCCDEGSLIARANEFYAFVTGEMEIAA